MAHNVTVYCYQSKIKLQYWQSDSGESDPDDPDYTPTPDSEFYKKSLHEITNV